jgi:hypothetical protein
MIEPTPETSLQTLIIFIFLFFILNLQKQNNPQTMKNKITPIITYIFLLCALGLGYHAHTSLNDMMAYLDDIEKASRMGSGGSTWQVVRYEVDN